MRALIINDDTRKRAAKVMAYAKDHPYLEGQPTPGDNPNFVAHLSTYRVVFTFTHREGRVYRHISISVPSEKYPHPAAAFTIAELFGFTGWDNNPEKMPDDWFGGVNEAEHCVVLGQEIKGVQQKGD